MASNVIYASTFSAAAYKIVRNYILRIFVVSVHCCNIVMAALWNRAAALWNRAGHYIFAL